MLRLAAGVVLALAANAQQVEVRPVELGERDVPASGASAQEARAAWAAAHGEWDAAHRRAVEWIARAVGEDGRVTGGSAEADVAATALAMLAIASEGATMRVGARRNAVKMTTIWLHGRQRPDGWYCDPAHPSAPLVQGLATLATTQIGVDSHYTLLREPSARGVKALAAHADGEREPLAAALALAAMRRTGGPETETATAAAALAQRLGASGLCDGDAGAFPLHTPVAGTRELASLAVAFACRGTDALPDTDPRLARLAQRVRDLPTRFGRDGELLDALTLWCATDVAFAAGGATRDAWRELVGKRVLPRFPAGAEPRSVVFTAGPAVLRNEAAETALTALALAVPWYRVGR